MPNDYFQFKQFRINQDRCAMKVCTDSCVLGAYADVRHATRILDIGTGTGLLALMLAQRTDARIDAVEIDKAATRQAAENAAQSPWASRIRVVENSILDFAQTHPAPYDCIVSNPPFFSNHLKRRDARQSAALHNDTLQLPDLIRVVQQLLTPQGRFIVMLPPHESTLLAGLCAETGLHKTEQLRLHDCVGGKLIRMIGGFGFSGDTILQTADLHIRDAGKQQYTDEFVRLLQPYYLHL